jgi:MFS family permease
LADDPRNHLLNRNVRLFLGTAALLSGSLFGSYAILLNLFLLRLGYGTAFIGLANGAGLICWAIASPIAGARANRIGYRRLMLIGLSGVVGGSTLMPFGAAFEGTTRGVWLVVSHAITFTGAGVFFVNMQPFMMGTVVPKLRSRVFSLSSATFPTAGFAGSLIGGFLPGLFAGWLGLATDDPATFRYSLHLVALAVVPTLLLIGATRDIDPVQSTTKRGPGSKAPLMIIAVMTVLGILRTFGEGSARTFFNVYMDAGLDVETVKIGITFAIAQLVAGPMALLSPILSNRIGTGPTALLAMTGVAICLVPMALIANPVAATVGLIAILALISIMRPAIAVYTMDLVRPEYWALMSGFVNFSWALGSGGTALAGGVIISESGYQGLFLTGAVVSGLGALLFARFLATRRNVAQSPYQDG